MTVALLSRIAADIRGHDVLGAGEAVLAMVSGGPDSTLLMHALVAAHDGPVHVLTVDHGLRPEAARECADVVRAATALGLPATIGRLHLAGGAGMQERARDARYAAARGEATRVGATAIALGHTLDDQAETVLMRIARGTGSAGAAGMAWRSGDLARPLLAVRAAEAREWCAARGCEVADDPSNADPAWTRVRARRVMDGLEGLHPGAAVRVADFAAQLRDERALLDELLEAAWRRCARPGGLDAAAVADQPEAMRRMLLRRLLATAGLDGDALDRRTLARVATVLDGPRRTQVRGGEVVRDRGVIRVLPAGEVTPLSPAPTPLPVPGDARFGDLTVRARRGVACAPQPNRVALRVTGDLGVRAARPGDRLPLAGGGRARVARMLAASGVPARGRGGVPVLTDDDRPVWVVGHRADPGALAPPGTPSVVVEVVG